MKMNAPIDHFNVSSLAGSIIREARQRKNYSLDDLAETSGLTIAELIALEAGDLPIRTHALRAGAALGVAASALSL